MSSSTDPPLAPFINIPNRSIICIEHPCFVRNIDKAFASLGGHLSLSNFLRQSSRSTIGVKLRPDDPLSKPNLSRLVNTKDILLRISVPKPTGNRRLKGSNLPFTPDPNFSPSLLHFPCDNGPSILLRSFRDNSATSTIQALGIITQSHRFRHIPDYQFACSNDSLMNKIRNSLLTLDYSKLKQFDLDLRPSQSVSLTDHLIGLPASFSHVTSQFNYCYEQNPALKTLEDATGKLITTTPQIQRTQITHSVPINAPSVPNYSPVQLTPIELLDPQLQYTIQSLRKILQNRPIISRRVSLNLLDPDARACHRHGWAYVGYVFKSGPWRDCLIRFGLDPRADPQYRKYQVITFRISVPHSSRHPQPNPRSSTSHIFDGKSVSLDGKIWQLCDLTDPILKRFVETEDLLSTPNLNGNGWYKDGTLATLKVILKDKLNALVRGIPINDLDYQPFEIWPSLLNSTGFSLTRLPSNIVTPKQFELAMKIKSKLPTTSTTYTSNENDPLHEQLPQNCTSSINDNSQCIIQSDNSDEVSEASDI